MKMDENIQIELEAAAFRHLVGFLQEKTDVQNIDLMNLAGFCRNCLSKWYLAAAEDWDPLHYRLDIAEQIPSLISRTVKYRKGIDNKTKYIK